MRKQRNDWNNTKHRGSSVLSDVPENRFGEPLYYEINTKNGQDTTPGCHDIGPLLVAKMSLYRHGAYFCLTHISIYVPLLFSVTRESGGRVTGLQ